MARNLFSEGEILAPKKGRNLFEEGEILAPKKQPSRQQQIWDMQERLTPQEALVSRLMSGVQAVNTAFGNTYHGILQPIVEGKFAKKYLDPAANFLRDKANKYLPENLKPKYEGAPIEESSRDVAKQRESDYKAEYELNPLSTLGGFGVGEFGKNLPAGYAGLRGLIPGIARGVIGSSLGGAIGGGLGGASQYINPGESRALNSILGAGTGLLFGGLGGAGYQAPGGIKNVAKAYPATKVAENIMAGKAATKAKYAKEYSDIFKDSGIKHIREPMHQILRPKRRLSINAPEIKPNNPKKYGEAYDKFQKNPTPELAQKAQSDLGKLINKIKSSSTSSLSSESDRIAQLTKVREGIIKDLTKSLEKKSPELAKRYKKAGEGYAKEYIPYKEAKDIAKFEQGKLTKDELTDALVKNTDFRNQMRDVHPELITRKDFRRNVIGSGLGLGTLGYKFGLFDSLLGGNHE